MHEQITRPVTPNRGLEIAARRLRSRYPRALWREIQAGRWHVICECVLFVTDTTFTVRGIHAVRRYDAPDRDTLSTVDLVAGTCTCPRGAAGERCEHYFAAGLWAQMTAVDRAYRAAHPNTCRKRWCAGRKATGSLLCQSHCQVLRRHADRQELASLRASQAVVDLARKLRGEDDDMARSA